MKKLLFVMNPYAGTRKANKSLAEILAVFNRAGYEVITYMTAEPGDCVQAVQQRAAQMDLIVCCGGDGTFNETVSGLLAADVDVPIGYIPAGSTNDFANSLKLSSNVVDAARQIVNGSIYSYDIGLFGDRCFTYVASFGAFTRTSYATPQSIKNALGHTAYLLEGLQELPQLKPIHARLDMEDEMIEDDFLFGAICNSTSVGGILTLDTNQVNLSDGLFEIFLVRAPKDIGQIGECVQALQTQQYNCSMITFRSTAALTVTMDPSVIWTLDGERAEGAKPISIRNLQQKIRLMK